MLEMLGVILIENLVSEGNNNEMDSTNKFLELQTRDLSNNIGKIAEFLEIDYDTSCIQTHFNKAKLGGNIINQNYMEILHSV